MGVVAKCVASMFALNVMIAATVCVSFGPEVKELVITRVEPWVELSILGVAGRKFDMTITRIIPKIARNTRNNMLFVGLFVWFIVFFSPCSWRWLKRNIG